MGTRVAAIRAVRYNRTTLLTVWFVAVLAGLGLSRLQLAVPGLAMVTTGLCATAMYRQRRGAAVLGMLLFGLTVGLWRGGMYMERLAPYQDLYTQKSVTFQARVQDDAVYGLNSQLLFDVQNPVFDATGQLPGRIKVSGYGENMVYRGDVVQVQGKLRAMRGGRQGQVSYAQLVAVRRGSTPVDTARREFSAGMQSALPEPVASFGLGLLTGQRSTLPQQTTTELSAVGLTHIVAVSGYNLTIIVLFVQRLMGKRSKYQTLLCALALMAVFLAVTGLNAAIVRASIVSTLTLLAWYYGRRIKPLLLISLVAAGTALWSPLYVWGDISWYLSFLAFFGVLTIGPLLTRRIYGTREPKLLAQTLIETTSAQIMTIPLTLYIFQQTSLVAIVSNMLVVPLVPLAMLLALIAGIGGAVFTFTAGWLAWPARIILTYMLDAAAALAKVPHAVARYSISAAVMTGMYCLIVALLLVLYRQVLRRDRAYRRVQAVSPSAHSKPAPEMV